MRLLVLGGTWFLGRAVVAEALERGHDVTTFNRGRSNVDLPGVRAIHGDRAEAADLASLARGRAWDVVIDTSGHVPRIVGQGARILADRVDRYVFVSTVSVYQDWPVRPLTEDSPVLDCPPDAGPDFGMDDPRGYPTQYGYQKAGAERAVSAVFGGRALMLRPAVIIGPHEYVGRIPWWLRRAERGGRMLAPGSPRRAIQPIDVRDVAVFALNAAVSSLTGPMNIAAPFDHATFGSLLAACVDVTGGRAQPVWVPDEVLLGQGVRQWTELPLWRTYPGTWRVDAGRARQAGLVCRPLADTVRDTWAWLRDTPGQLDHERAAELGIDPAKEAQILATHTAIPGQKQPTDNTVEQPPT